MRVTAEKVFEIAKRGEGLHVEMKACRDAVPRSVWETYSAFANTRGGVILLGVTEQDKYGYDRFRISGVKDANKVVTDFFNILNNKQKVSRSVLVDSDVRIVEVEGRDVVYINVREADYRQKPVYINNNLQSGTYKRVHEGDRHVTDEELAMLIRDSTDDADIQIIEHYGMDDLDAETLRKYRQSFISFNPGHAFGSLSDKEFLIKMGGYAISRQKDTEGLTMAGLLMFGKSQHIHENFPMFRVDYLDLIDIEPGDSKKWNDRLTDDGRWEDNLYNFLHLSMRKLLFTLPSEGKLHGIVRKDGGPLHEGVREAMINAITYCDYKLGGVLRIDRRTDRIVMRNPGTLRISPERIYNGDYTQARNSTIQKMLRVIGFGDNIGSGFQKILNAWDTIGLPQPDIHEENEVNEVWLTLPLQKPTYQTPAPYNKNTENETVNDTVNEPENSTPYGTVNELEKGTENETVNDTVNETVKGTENETVNPISKTTATITNAHRKVYELITANNNITYAQLQKDTTYSRGHIGRIVADLKREGYIVRKGSDKTGSWEIKRSLTNHTDPKIVSKTPEK